MWTADCPIGDHSARRYDRVSVKYSSTSDADVIEAEVTISLHTEPTDVRLVDLAFVLQVQQVKLTQLCIGIDYDIFPNASAEHAIVKNLERRVHRENALASRSAWCDETNPAPKL